MLYLKSIVRWIAPITVGVAISLFMVGPMYYYNPTIWDPALKFAIGFSIFGVIWIGLFAYLIKYEKKYIDEKSKYLVKIFDLGFKSYMEKNESNIICEKLLGKECATQFKIDKETFNLTRKSDVYEKICKNFILDLSTKYKPIKVEQNSVGEYVIFFKI